MMQEMSFLTSVNAVILSRHKVGTIRGYVGVRILEIGKRNIELFQDLCTSSPYISRILEMAI